MTIFWIYNNSNKRETAKERNIMKSLHTVTSAAAARDFAGKKYNKREGEKTKPKHQKNEAIKSPQLKHFSAIDLIALPCAPPSSPPAFGSPTTKSAIVDDSHKVVVLTLLLT